MRTLVLGVFVLTSSWVSALGVWISGEALCLRPTVDNPYFAIVGVFNRTGASALLDVPQGDQVGYCPAYHWGGRLELGWRICDGDLRLDWTTFSQPYRLTLRADPGDAIYPTLGPYFLPIPEGRALFREDHRYNAIDGDIGLWNCSRGGCLVYRLFGGIRYGRFTVDRTIQYLLPTGTTLVGRVAQLSDSQGIGPRLGIKALLKGYRCFALSGEASSALLLGSTKSFYETNPTNAINTDLRTIGRVRNRSICRVLPTCELKFGLEFDQSICCVGLSGGLGYQLTHYWSGVQRTLFMNNSNPVAASGSNVTQLSGYSLVGWYFRLGARY